jgi:hypothetical protein
VPCGGERSPRYAIYSDILASFLASVNTNKLFVEQIYKGVLVFSTSTKQIHK